MVAAITGVAIVVGFGWLYMNQAINTNAQQKALTESHLKEQKLEETQAKVADISNNLKLVTQVLGQEVLFSKLLEQIGSVMPKDAVLTDMNIAKTTGGIDIKAAAVDQATATQVQVNLQDPANKIFEKVDILSITCGGASYGGKYPCAVQLRASFNSCNQFLFVTTDCSKTGVTKP